MQVVQRGMLQRIGLLIGRNRDDDRPVDLADRELVGLKPAEIECIAGSVEIDVGIASPIPIDLGCRLGGASIRLVSAAPPKSLKSWFIYLAPSTGLTIPARAPRPVVFSIDSVV